MELREYIIICNYLIWRSAPPHGPLGSGKDFTLLHYLRRPHVAAAIWLCVFFLWQNRPDADAEAFNGPMCNVRMCIIRRQRWRKVHQTHLI